MLEGINDNYPVANVYANKWLSLVLYFVFFCFTFFCMKDLEQLVMSNVLWDRKSKIDSRLVSHFSIVRSSKKEKQS